MASPKRLHSRYFGRIPNCHPFRVRVGSPFMFQSVGALAFLVHRSEKQLPRMRDTAQPLRQGRKEVRLQTGRSLDPALLPYVVAR